MSIILSLFIVIGPIAIICCVVKAIQHTIITRRRNEMPTALIASLWASNGPDRRYGVK